MAIELATGYVSVVPSFKGGAQALSSGLDGPLDNEGRKAGRRFGSGFALSLKPALAGLAATAGAAFAVDFVGDAIGAASDVAESVSKNTVVFGEASDAVLAFADNAANAFGQSKRQALEATGTFGNLLRSVGLNEEKSADFSTSLTGLASDLASFNNVPVDDALNALRSGLVGETEPLKRFGINLNEAALKQKALELGLSDGKTTLDANAKSQAAYALIMEQSTLAQGDFARTSDGLANQQRILGARFEDVKAKIGAALLPILTTVVTAVNDNVIPAITALVTLFKEEGLGGVVTRVGQAFQNALPGILDSLGNLARSLGQWIIDQAPILGQKLLDLGKQFVSWVAPQIPPLLLELAGLMADVGAWILSDGVPLLVEKTKELAIALVDWVLTDALPGVILALPDFLEGINDWLTEEAVPEMIAAGKQLGLAIAEGFRDSFTSIFGDSFDFLKAGELDFGLFSIGGREHGGPVNAGTPYVVGERRPELFVPSVSGTILPEVPAGVGVGNTFVANIFNPIPEDAEDGVFRAHRRAAALMGA